MRKLIILLILTFAMTSGADNNRWMMIGTGNDVTRWTHVNINDIIEIGYHGLNSNQTDTSARLPYMPMMTVMTTDSLLCNFPLDAIKSVEIGRRVPAVYIDIEERREVVNKEEYLKATFKLIDYDDPSNNIESSALQIKGRGNSTWSFDKKPYRLKFDKKTRIGHLRKGKSYVLLANYIDNTLMRNAVALRMAQMLEMPYTCNYMPVDLYVNGTYRGAYMITEKVGISSNSLDIDEKTGILLELDTNYDEKYKFRSAIFDLPVMVKDPDLDELYDGPPWREIIPDTIIMQEPKAEYVSLDSLQPWAIKHFEKNDSLTFAGYTPESVDSTVIEEHSQALLRQWQADFNRLESAINNVATIGVDSVGKLIDLPALADYLLVYCVTANFELNHPKSVFLYKEHPDSLWKPGPVWDFDWAFTFNGKEMPERYNTSLLIFSNQMSVMLRRLANRKEFLNIYKARWEYFYTQLWPKLLDEMDAYSNDIRLSALHNGELWHQSCLPDWVSSSENFDANYATLRQWLINRVKWMNSRSSKGLY